MLAIDEVTDLFQDHAGVRVANRIDSKLHQAPEDLA